MKPEKYRSLVRDRKVMAKKGGGIQYQYKNLIQIHISDLQRGNKLPTINTATGKRKLLKE